MYLPALWGSFPATGKFYLKGLSVYPEAELYRETAFIAYYFHWSAEEILALPHTERRRFCAEISSLHQKIQPGRQSSNPFVL